MPDTEVFSEVVATLSQSFLELIPGNKDDFLSNHLSTLCILVHQELDKNLIYLSGKLENINKSKQVLESSLLVNSDEIKNEGLAEDSFHSNNGDAWDTNEQKKETENTTSAVTIPTLENVKDYQEKVDTEKFVETEESSTRKVKSMVSKRGRKIKLPVKLENYDELPLEPDEDIDSDPVDEVKNTTKDRRKRKVGRPRKVKLKETEVIETDDDKTEENKTDEQTDSVEKTKGNIYLNKRGNSRQKFSLIYENTLVGKSGIKKYYEDRLPFKFFCNICSFKSKRESHFHKHLELHTKNPDLKLHKCDKCDFTAIRVSVLQRHSLSHVSNDGDILQCSECNYSTNNEALLRVHHKRHMKKTRHKCKFCNFSTMYKQKLLKHQDTHSESPGMKGTDTPNTSMYQCIKCPYKTANKLNFLRHQRAVHLNQRPHLCDTCGMAFKRTDALQIHKEIHKDRSERRLPFSCKVCQKAFKSMAHVKEHMSVHTTVRSFQCHICGQMFKTRQVQQRHLQGVHLKTNWHECSRCKRCFSSKYTLKRHLRQHDEDGNVNLQGQIADSVEVNTVGQQSDFVKNPVQEQLDENATAIQTITISTDNLGEFSQQLQTVSGQLQQTGDIGEVYIQGLDNVVSDTVNIVSIQGDDIGQILTSSSEPNYTEHVPQLSAAVTDSKNAGVVQDLIHDNVKLYQNLTSEQGLQIVSDKQSLDITAERADFNIPAETFKLTLDQINSGTESNTNDQLMNQGKPELQVLNYETVHYVSDQGQGMEGETEGHFVQFITSDGQTYRIYEG